MFDQYNALAQELYDKKEYLEAISIYDEMIQLDSVKFKKTLLFVYSWSLYKGLINQKDAFEKENEEITKTYIKFIIDNFSNNDLLYQLTAFRVIKNFKSKTSFDAEGINFWLDKLNPETLSTETWISNFQGKSTVNQSKKEEWYALKSKVYLKLEMYKACIEISNKALEEFTKLHNDNDKWFKHKIAISHHNLGNYEEALTILKGLILKDKRWFFYKDISEIYTSIGNIDDALKYGIDAILLPGDDDKKLNLYWNIGLLFSLKEDIEMSKFLKCLSIKIRIENNWKLSSIEKEYYGINQEFIDDKTINNLIGVLNNQLKKFKFENLEKQYGMIDNILPNNKAGFIKNSKGASHYFKVRDVIGNRNNLSKNKSVEYYLDKGFDKRRNIETDIAVNIKILEG